MRPVSANIFHGEIYPTERHIRIVVGYKDEVYVELSVLTFVVRVMGK